MFSVSVLAFLAGLLVGLTYKSAGRARKAILLALLGITALLYGASLYTYFPPSPPLFSWPKQHPLTTFSLSLPPLLLFSSSLFSFSY